ncbi:hypothetical protein ACLOJK_018387 [Asimina triloba]
MGMLLVCVVAVLVIATTLPRSASASGAHSHAHAEEAQENESSSASAVNHVVEPGLFDCIKSIPPLLATCTVDFWLIITNQRAHHPRLGSECCKVYGITQDECLRKALKAFFNYEWPELNRLLYILKNGCILHPSP